MIIDLKVKVIIAIGFYALLATVAISSLLKENGALKAEVSQKSTVAKVNDAADAGYISAADNQCKTQINKAIAAAKIKPTVAVKPGVTDEKGCPVCDCATISLYELKSAK